MGDEPIEGLPTARPPQRVRLPQHAHRDAIGRAMPHAIDRRQAIVGSAAALGTLLLGCDRQQDPEGVATTPDRPPVPLRVVLIGDSVSGEYLQRAWEAFNETPLDVKAVAVSRAASAPLGEQALAHATSADVLIYPLIAAADLYRKQQITSLDLSSLEGIENASAQIPAAVRAGVARFADQTIALPLSGQLPALFSVEPIDALQNWREWDQLVAAWDGMAAEPSAPGWAGSMFLWRAMSTTRNEWLFDRETFEPLIASPPFVECLTLMSETHRRYASTRMAPAEIWSAIQQGTLRGGIGFAPAQLEAFPDVQLSAIPGGGLGERVLFDPFTPLASLSAFCRQSALAKQFLAWLASDDGSAAVAQCLRNVTQVIEPEQSSGEAIGSRNPYEQWLHEALQTPVTVPTLQIASGGAYYAALDRAVGDVLDGKSPPNEALQQVAARWVALTEAAGKNAQLRLWHQAQGRRG